jgi:hypothetical protein
MTRAATAAHAADARRSADLCEFPERCDMCFPLHAAPNSTLYSLSLDCDRIVLVSIRHDPMTHRLAGEAYVFAVIHLA